MKLIHSGKVREVYADGDDILLVATDRVSVYDVVLPTPIPDKGKVLTALSLWWFDQLADVAPNHVVSGTDVPRELAGRAIRCKRLEILPVEWIARGYLAGLGWDSYRETGQVSGVTLPAGLMEGSQLPAPVFTPSTKTDPAEGHDEHISRDQVAELVGPTVTDELGALTVELYARGAAIAKERGVIIADTKFEFGRAADGSLVLADEILTPDSSRFWRVEDWAPGGRQKAYDKQFVRDWARDLGWWDKRPPGPEIPPKIVEETRRRYVDIYERITGQTWE